MPLGFCYFHLPACLPTLYQGRLQCLSSFIGFQFPGYRSATSLVKFFSRHFTLFDAIGNGVVFLKSFSDSLSLVCRNAG